MQSEPVILNQGYLVAAGQVEHDGTSMMLPPGSFTNHRPTTKQVTFRTDGKTAMRYAGPLGDAELAASNQNEVMQFQNEQAQSGQLIV